MVTREEFCRRKIMDAAIENDIGVCAADLWYIAA